MLKASEYQLFIEKQSDYADKRQRFWNEVDQRETEIVDAEMEAVAEAGAETLERMISGPMTRAGRMAAWTRLRKLKVEEFAEYFGCDETEAKAMVANMLKFHPVKDGPTKETRKAMAEKLLEEEPEYRKVKRLVYAGGKVQVERLP